MSSERMQKSIWNKTLKSYKYFKIKFPAWSSLKEECRSWQSTYLKCSSEGTLGILKANVNLPRANYKIKKKKMSFPSDWDQQGHFSHMPLGDFMPCEKF